MVKIKPYLSVAAYIHDRMPTVMNTVIVQESQLLFHDAGQSFSVLLYVDEDDTRVRIQSEADGHVRT